MNPKKTFEKFYNANIDKIYRFVFFRTGHNKELAEDLVSEIFFKALRNFEKYDEKISRSAWIFTIAKNHLANYWRDNAKKNEISLTETIICDEDNNELVVGEHWMKMSLEKQQQSQTKLEIYEILAKLSPSDRELVTFHYLYRYSYAEIARMTGKTETSVKVAAHRAIKKLRVSL